MAFRIFLYEKGGNPNKTNAKKETALHCVCVEKNFQFYNVQKRRVECMNMVLNWRGATLQEGQLEKVDVGAQDEVSAHNCQSLHMVFSETCEIRSKGHLSFQ